MILDTTNSQFKIGSAKPRGILLPFDGMRINLPKLFLIKIEAGMQILILI